MGGERTFEADMVAAAMRPLRSLAERRLAPEADIGSKPRRLGLVD
jgi:hypothetical protein